MANVTREVRSLEQLKQVCQTFRPGQVSIVFPPDGSLEAANDINRLLKWGAGEEGFLVVNPEVIRSKSEIFLFVKKRVDKISDAQLAARKKISGMKSFITTLRGKAGLDGGSPPKKARLLMDRAGSSGGSAPTVVEFGTLGDAPPCYVLPPSALGKRGMQDRESFPPPQRKTRGFGSPSAGMILHEQKPSKSPGKIVHEQNPSKSPGKKEQARGVKSDDELKRERERDAESQKSLTLFNLQLLQVKLKLLEEQEASLGRARAEMMDLLSGATC